MFSDRSRYKSVPTDTVKLPGGRMGTVVRFPVRTRPALLGYHQRLVDQRLDHIASFYLQDPAAYWLLCDANQSRSPHALAVRDLVGIPRKER